MTALALCPGYLQGAAPGGCIDGRTADVGARANSPPPQSAAVTYTASCTRAPGVVATRGETPVVTAAQAVSRSCSTAFSTSGSNPSRPESTRSNN